jgi:hypothetical protein
MASYQKVVALKGVTVLGVVDLLVRTVYTDSRPFDEDAASVGNVGASNTSRMASKGKGISQVAPSSTLTPRA